MVIGEGLGKLSESRSMGSMQQLITQSSVSFALSGLRLTRNPKTWCSTDFSFAEKSKMAKSGEATEERCLVGIHSMTEIKVQSHGSM